MNTLKMIGAMIAVFMGTAACGWSELCVKCKDGMYTADIGTCAVCGGTTSSGAFKLCKACSTKLHQCEHCRAALADEMTGAITRATLEYVKKESPIPDPLVTVEKTAAGYARVKVRSKAGQTDAATAFLKLEQGTWKVLALGTAFSPADCDKLNIPAPLRR